MSDVKMVQAEIERRGKFPNAQKQATKKNLANEKKNPFGI